MQKPLWPYTSRKHLQTSVCKHEQKNATTGIKYSAAYIAIVHSVQAIAHKRLACYYTSWDKDTPDSVLYVNDSVNDVMCNWTRGGRELSPIPPEFIVVLKTKGSARNVWSQCTLKLTHAYCPREIFATLILQHAGLGPGSLWHVPWTIDRSIW